MRSKSPIRTVPRRPSISISALLLGLASACTPDSDTTLTTGFDESGTSVGDGNDTGPDDSNAEAESSEDTGSCINQPKQCAELVACLEVVLPDIDVSSIEAGGSCWCDSTPQEAQACAEHCVSQLEIVEKQFPDVEECGGGGSNDDDPTTGDGDGDGDPGPLPNLTLYQFYLDNHELAPGDTVDYYFELVNEGPVDTQYVYNDRLILSVNDVLGDDDDIVFYTIAWQYIVEANENYLFYAPVTLPDDLPSGEFFVAMELDYTNIIKESDETDNWMIDADKVTIIGIVEVDLASSNVVASEYALKAGASTNVEVTIDNLGPDDVGPYSVRFYYSTDPDITTSDVLLCTVDEDGLAANTATVVQSACEVPNLDGDYYLGAIVDPGNLIAETDEDNNAAFDATPVSITPPQLDLSPTVVSSSSHTVDVGELVNFSATITNNGPDPSPAFSLSFYYSTDATVTTNDTLICQATGPALQPGASSPVNKNCAVPSLPTNNYRLGVIVDPYNTISETDETNNVAVDPDPVSVTAPHVDLAYDYHGDNLLFFAEPGDPITYTLDVWNHGNDASPSFEASMVWSLDQVIGLGDVHGCTIELTPIPALTKMHYQFNCTVPNNLQPGAYYSGVIIDPSNEVPETDETNNRGVSFDTQIFQ